MSWSPGGLRKPLQLQEDMHGSESDENTSWERRGVNEQHISRKTSKCLFMLHFLLIPGLQQLQRESTSPPLGHRTTDVSFPEVLLLLLLSQCGLDVAASENLAQMWRQPRLAM